MVEEDDVEEVKCELLDASAGAGMDEKKGSV
jgi:hypothetical protein